jgi:hypothetical protein
MEARKKIRDVGVVLQLALAGVEELPPPIETEEKQEWALQRGSDADEQGVEGPDERDERVRIHGKVLLRTTNAAGV